MNNRIYRSEDGYALIISLFLLAILMVAGVLISNTSVTDLGTVRGAVVYTQNAAAAESAAMTAVQLLENSNDSVALDPLESGTGDLNWIIPAGMTEPAYTVEYGSGTYGWAVIPANTISSLSSRALKDGAKIEYIVRGWNTTMGASLGTYTEMLRESVVKGVYYSPTDGVFTVEVGFKKRF